MSNEPTAPRRAYRRSAWKLWLVAIICAAPVVAACIAFYWWQPQGRVNYGELIVPQRPQPTLTLTTLDGKPFDLATLRGKWVMLTVDQSACAAACVDKLYAMRQVRTATGKERERIERVWLITDAAAPATSLQADYEGTRIVHADAQALRAWLGDPANDRLETPIYLVDPLGDWMLRWPSTAEPKKILRDINRLLSASRVG